MKQIKIDSDLQIRLDHYLVETLQITRSHITKMIKDGDVLVNLNKVKPGYLLRQDDEIKINDVQTKTLDLKPIDLNLEIVYEDDYLLVINKPKGLVVHPAKSHKDKTLVHGLLFEMEKLSDINGVFRPGIIHRIDKDTSGLIMVAKTNEAHQILAKDLASHTIKRSYQTLVHGTFEETKGTINAPVGRHPKQRIKNAVVADGKHAVTHFEVLKSFKKYTLLKCDLETGRTHQIRVHLSYIHHPIVGDPLYGLKSMALASGQMLHAYKLAFNHPITKKAMTFEVSLPAEFTEFINQLN